MKPAFTAATGAGFSGTGNASGTLEADIAAGEISPNVFESVGGDNITPLEPKFTNWYIPYAGTSMVIAYNPKSQVRERVQGLRGRLQAAEHLFSTLLQTPGLKLGRTDPNTDPQGRDFIYMLELAQKYYNLPVGHGRRRSSAPPTSAPRTPARSTPSPRSTPRSSPASSTRPARSSPRRSS